MNTTDEILNNLVPCSDNRYAGEQSMVIDSNIDLFTYKWRELAAGSDPYNDYEEYYRLDVSLLEVCSFIHRALAFHQTCTQRISGKVSQSYTHYDDYSGFVGGTGGIAWGTLCRDDPDAREVDVDLRFTPGERFLKVNVIYRS